MVVSDGVESRDHCPRHRYKAANNRRQLPLVNHNTKDQKPKALPTVQVGETVTEVRAAVLMSHVTQEGNVVEPAHFTGDLHSTAQQGSRSSRLLQSTVYSVRTGWLVVVGWLRGWGCC